MRARTYDRPRPLEDDRMLELSKGANVCPFKKDDGHEYQRWKANNIPIAWFVNSSKRPSKDDIVIHPTGFALLDIDRCPGEDIITNHPAVYGIYKSANGTHILTHALGYGDTPEGWSDTYHKVAYSVLRDIWKKQPNIQLDPKNSLHTQGCYLWHSEWILNPNYDPQWKPQRESVPQETLDKMYDKPVSKGKKGKATTLPITDEEIKKLPYTPDVLKDFRDMDYSVYLEYHADDYTIVKGKAPKYTYEADLDGNVTQICRNTGTVVSIWYPYMSVGKGNVNDEGRIEKGHRRRSLYCHLISICKFLGERIDRDYILYDSVNWIYRHCERGEQFPKCEILQEVANALSNWKNEERHNPCVDRRGCICGDYYIDPATGEEMEMDRRMKLSRNARMRKKYRVEDALSFWIPSSTFDENVDELVCLTARSRRTIVGYLRAAMQVPELVERHPWLAGIKLPTSGRRTQAITIKDREGTIHEFTSKKACMAFLGCSKPTLVAFLNGKSRLNKRFELIRG